MASITAPFEGCHYIEDLLAQGIESITWTIRNEVQGHRYQAALFMGDVQGCQPTTHHQRGLFITGGSANLRSVDAGEVIEIRFDLARHVKQDPCGRVWQFDAENDTTDEFHAGLFTFKKPKPPCGREQPDIQPWKPVELPPLVPEIEVPTPHVPDVPMEPIPEPATMLLVGGAMALATLRQRARKR